MLLVLSNKGKGMQSSSEQPLVGEERYVTTLITAAKETSLRPQYAKYDTWDVHEVQKFHLSQQGRFEANNDKPFII